MRHFFPFFAIILTLGSTHAETTTTCSTVQAGTQDLSWLEDLSNALAASAKTPTASKPRPTAKPLVKEEPRRSGDSSDHYDLEEPTLSRLRRAARFEAAKCRTNLATGKTLCGINVSKYRCYRGVKDALVDAGLVDAWWSEVAASDAHDRGTLEKKGFKNVMSEGYDSTNAPLGAVLVYSGGSYRCGENGHKKTCGHIEIKLGQNEYCSDCCKAIPVDNYISRKLVGIYVKE